MEVTVSEVNGNVSVVETPVRSVFFISYLFVCRFCLFVCLIEMPIRRDAVFLFWYTVSMAWHPTLTTGVLPLVGLTYMNTQIFLAIRYRKDFLQ